MQTQSAADRFAAEADGRRPAIPVPAPATAPVDWPAAVDQTQAERELAEQAPAGDFDASEPLVAVARADDDIRPSTTAVAAPAQLPETVGPPHERTSAASEPAVVAAPAPPAPVSATLVTTATPAAIEAPTSRTTQAQPAADTPVAEAAPPAETSALAPATTPRYKDGTYTGWGSSRHGDIEAQVVIENGRITSATIARCLMRWPCSWISALPPQVVERQSAETDYVSGATQSTNAFYYGVVQALGKASLQ